MTEKWRDDLAEESERLAWIATCTADELRLMLPWLMTDPLGFDEQRARIEQARCRCRCGHPVSWHEHYRAGTDCSVCDCARFERARVSP
jgi:hypothetical protein